MQILTFSPIEYVFESFNPSFPLQIFYCAWIHCSFSLTKSDEYVHKDISEVIFLSIEA